MERWPNFFIVGAPRCGTTSLYEYLRHTKGVYMSPVKEPNYFSVGIIPDNYRFSPIRNKKKYLSLFSSVKNEKAIGESSVTYLQDPKAPFLIQKVVHDAKIIMLLRNPIDRTFSHYLHFVSIGFEKRLFEDAINDNLSEKDTRTGKDYIGSSMYSEQVKRYFDIFGKKNIKIIYYDDFSYNTRDSVKKILTFLGINEEPPKIVDTIFNKYSGVRGSISKFVINSSYLTKLIRFLPESFRIYTREQIITNSNISKPNLTKENKEKLRKIFDQDLQKLEKIMGTSLPWLKSQV